MNNPQFLVQVCCMTYNQALYIEEALNGFCMQETTFPFVCTILDDASTDGEQEIIRKYLQAHFDLEDKTIVRNEETDDYILTFARHKTNANCFFAVFYLKYNHWQARKAKDSYYKEWQDRVNYIAFCEGDDYWISKKLLQTFAAFLDGNKDYSSVFGNRIVSNEKGSILSIQKFEGDLTIHDIMRGQNPGYRNLLFRKDILDFVFRSKSNGDLQTYYRCAISGKMKYIDGNFAVYRYTMKGVSSSLKGNDAIYTSMFHYYRFHEETGFLYQRDLVNYQVLSAIRKIGKVGEFLYTVKMIRKFHVPTLKRYFWYGPTIFQMTFELLKTHFCLVTHGESAQKQITKD